MQEYSHTETALLHPWGLMGTFLLGLLILGLTYVVSYLVYMAYYTYGYELGLPLDASPEYNGFLIAISSLIILPVMLGLLALCIFMRKGISFNEYIGLKPVSLAKIFQWNGLLLVFLIISEMVSWLIGRPYVPEFMTQVYLSAGSPVLLLIALAIAVPVTEEFFFRGFLMTGLRASRVGWVGAIIICALLWSLIHIQYDWYDIGWVFLMGLILGYGKKQTGSIYVPLIMHAMINAMAFFGVASYVDNQPYMATIQQKELNQSVRQEYPNGVVDEGSLQYFSHEYHE